MNIKGFFLTLLSVSSIPTFVQAQVDVSPVEVKIVAAISDLFPCPPSSDRLKRWEKRVNARLAMLRSGEGLFEKALRDNELIDMDLIESQVEDYIAQCSSALNPGAEDPDREDRNQPAPPPGFKPAGGLADVCASVTSILDKEMLIKSEISKHITNPGDKRSTGYTLVCGSQCVQNLKRADFFYSDGSLAGSVAYYGRFSGNNQPRLYGGVGEAPQHFAQEIAQKAAGIGNGKLYMQTSSSVLGADTTCKEFAPQGRNGGV